MRIRRRLIFFSALCGVLVLLGSVPRTVRAQSRPRAVAAVSIDEVRQWDGVVTSMSREGELRLARIDDDTLVAGRSHERLDQYYGGVRVFGGALARQLEGATTVSVFGQLYTGIDVDTTPALSGEEAQGAAGRSVGAASGNAGVPELVVLPLDGDGFRLAYRVRIVAGGDIVISFVDAQDGHIVDQYSDVERQAAVGKGTGVFGDNKKVSARASAGAFVAEDLLRPADILTFDMKGSVTRTLNFLNGLVSLGASNLANSTNNTWTDGPDVDGHVYAGLTYDYYFKRFGRRGLNDRNLRTIVLIHPVQRSDLQTSSNDIIGLFFLNAFYAGDGVVCYGEGLPPGFVLSPFQQTVNYFSAGLDVVAHELSHGVTEFSSGLIYRNESGALNEAFSDFMGLSAKFFFEPFGEGLMQANYGLASDVIRPGGIRSFNNPGVFGDPDHYSKRYLGTDDNGGVHTNCTIVDHAFYLAIEGGTNRTSGLSVQGVGGANREQIEKAFYRGFTAFLTPSATFSMARAATLQAARDLYGAGSAPERAITQAWTAVGVN